ncbi:MAG: T9SS type A sorting domain-containing protein [Chitinophagales bacterium]|nr:T9SS type A sorting domain-containing protein [Chitinophagales bacterium]MDW8417921.1 choice-of-anchor V domain-containing protein [Chitinophagales bacterium]
MRKLHVVYLLFSVASVWFLFSSNSGGIATVGNSDRTGSPGSAGVCGNCHSGGAFGQVTLSIQVFQVGTNTPVTSYVGGTTYDMRVTVNHTSGSPAGFGFQMTCLTTPGNSPAGSYSNLASNVKQKTITTGTYTGRTYVEHNGVTNNNVFNFRWTAPPAGTGTVRFYAAGNAVNGASGTSGDNSGVASITLIELTPLSISGVKTNVTCFGGNNGSINITVTGGTPNYSYLWNDGVTTEDRSNLTAGIYTVTVTDQSSQTASASFDITQPSAPVSITGNVTNVSCNGGNNGAIITTVNNGNPPYSYSWSHGAGTSNVSNLTAGSYTLLVQDNNGCTASASFQVNQPAPLSANANFPPILCNGGTTTIQINANGGTPPYNIAPNNFSVTAGTYSYTVTDANGCAASVSVNVTQPAPLVASATNITLPCTGGSGTVSVTATGGTPPYSGTGNYTLSTPGTYQYTVTDANGCTSIATANAFSSTGFTDTSIIIPPTCGGVCTGAIIVTPINGTAPYTFSWNTGSTSSNLTQICGGTYSLTITDNDNCQLIKTYIVPEPAPLILQPIQVTPIKCHDDTATLTAIATGGTGTINYSWSNGYNGTVSFSNGGNVSLTVADQNGCTASASVTVNNPPAPIQINAVNITPSSGSNGAIDISVSGGTSPYTYNWSNGATTQDLSNLPPGLYNVTVTDANQCVSSAQFNVIVTDLTEALPVSVSLYPNPFSETLYVITDTELTAVIFDIYGRDMMHIDLMRGSNVLQLGRLAPAQYILEIRHSNQTLRKIIVKH